MANNFQECLVKVLKHEGGFVNHPSDPGGMTNFKLLQDAIGVVADGVIGPNTMAKINEANVETLIDKFSEARTSFYKGLKTFPVFGKGWLSRTESERLEALDMAKNG